MDYTLQSISELCRDPMISVRQGAIEWMNAAACRQFPLLRTGGPATQLLPEHVLRESSERFMTSALIDGHSYAISAAHGTEDVLLLALFPEASPQRADFMSDALISGMFSVLFNLQLSAEQLRRRLDPSDSENEKYLAMLFHSYYTLYHKLSNLAMARSSSDGSTQLAFQQLDLVALCRGLERSANYLRGDRLAPIEFVSALESLPACMDAPKVERLLVNLLSNALKHTPANGHIRLRLAKNGDNATISVDDDGEGIPPEILNGIFRSYEKRLEEQSFSRPETGGLGLWLCRTITEQHGGALILESREQQGTSIRLTLPLRSQELQLRSDLPNYENGGMFFLLTELSDVLEWPAYLPEYAN